MATDLFTWINALWTKEDVEGTPPIFMMHRFLASNKKLAGAAHTLSLDHAREPRLAFHTWQGLLPKGKGAPRSPRLSYVAPKKGAAAEALTVKMMRVLAERRVVVEEMQAIVVAAGREQELYIYFGVESTCVASTTKKGAVQTKKKGGLLAGL